MKSIFPTLMITLFATSAVAPVGAKEFYLGFGIGPMGALKSGYASDYSREDDCSLKGIALQLSMPMVLRWTDRLGLEGDLSFALWLGMTDPTGADNSTAMSLTHFEGSISVPWVFYASGPHQHVLAPVLSAGYYGPFEIPRGALTGWNLDGYLRYEYLHGSGKKKNGFFIDVGYGHLGVDGGDSDNIDAIGVNLRLGYVGLWKM